MLKLSEVTWPIYPLNKDIKFKDYNGLKLARGPASTDWRLLDAPQLPYATVGLRRLNYMSAPTVENYALYKLSVPIYRYSDIFQYINNTDMFLDTSGKIIQYERTRYVPLIYHKIKKFKETSGGYTIEIEDVHSPLFLNREPSIDDRFAGILQIGKGYVLYSLEPDRLNNTRRMV